MRHSINSALLACGLLATAWSAAAAPFFSHHGYAYYYSSSTSWAGAKAEAVALGGNLWTVNSQAEQNAVLAAAGSAMYWIGFNDAASEGNFVWSSGEPVTFTDWTPGEPNNFGGIENYAVVNWFGAKWNDFPDVVGYPQVSGIIEVPTRDSVPEPRTVALIGIALASLRASRRRRI